MQFRVQGLLPAAVLVLLTGCQPAVPPVPTLVRDYKPHVEQVLDNVAKFDKNAASWPTHMLVYKGFYESRHTTTGAVGSTTKIEGSDYVTMHWELASLEDPYDIRRVRLLYQWVVGTISFDDLERRWSEIKDRAILDGNGKPILGGDGRPKYQSLALPITRESKRDWFSSKPAPLSASGLGVDGLHRIWVTDPNAAAEFSIAVLSAMANSRVKARWGDAVMMVP